MKIGKYDVEFSIRDRVKLLPKVYKTPFSVTINDERIFMTEYSVCWLDYFFIITKQSDDDDDDLF